jgi:cellobiose phosphorylase
MNMINPVNHANTPEKVAVYRVEPYVVAADVYALPPHTGRGGWTWYTGSAGWMYRLIVESLLGIERAADKLHISPHLPADWTGFKFRYRYGETTYDVTVSRVAGAGDAPAVRVDGELQTDNAIPLSGDGNVHVVEVHVRSTPPDGGGSSAV